MTGDEPKLYRPSNSDEGMAFEAKFCDLCELDEEYRKTDRNGCDILARALACEIDQPLYPRQWRYVDGKPTCTAFRPVGTPSPAECEEQRRKYEAAMSEMRAAQGGAE